MNRLHDTPGEAGATTHQADAAATLDRLFALTVLMAETMDHDLRARGLSRARATVLAYLHRAGAMTQRELADLLKVTPRNVTGLIDALERSGHVARGPHPSDRRATLVGLTSVGRAAAEALAADRGEFASVLFDRLDASTLGGLHDVLERLIERLQQRDIDERRRAALERWRSLRQPDSRR